MDKDIDTEAQRQQALSELEKSLGVRPCITDPPKRIFVAGGLDWCKLYVFGCPTTADLLNRLEKAKTKLKEGGREEWIDLAGMTWRVEAFGDGKGSNNLPYLLTCAGLRLALGSRAGSGPVAMIEAQGSYCAGRDPQELHKELKEIVCKVGVNPDRFTVSRLDVHGDMAGLHLSTFVKVFASGGVIKRAKKWSLFGEGNFEDVSGLYFGKRGRGAYCRIYDKVRELERDEDKLKSYLAAHDLTELPESLTRVEFELSGEWFREEWRDSDSDAVFDRLGTITEYLMHDWLRFCFHVDRRHTDHAKPCSWWKYLGLKMAQQMHGFQKRSQKPRPIPRTSKYLEQIRGNLAALVGGKLGQGPPDIASAFNQFVVPLFKESDQLKFRDSLETKCLQHDQRVAEWELWCSQGLAEAG
jgi:hypothetical protein